MYRDLIICKSCGNEHEANEVKRVTRFTCDHCGKEHDTENDRAPNAWSLTREANVIRFMLCANCTTELGEWLHPSLTSLLADTKSKV